MKKLITILLMFPIIVAAQKTQSMDDAMKKMEELKKQMTPEQRAMMDNMGIDKTMQNAQKAMQQQGKAGTAMMPMGDPNKIPATISSFKIPATPTSKEQLIAYLKPIYTQTEKAMNPVHVASVKPFLGKPNQTEQLAMMFWANNELDKTLYLLENACITNPDDYLSLNNLAALLTLSGYAHKALPLLLYTQKFVPESGTLLNNIGQAYLSLGYADKAKPLLISASTKDTTNAEAYRSLAMIAQKQGNKTLCGSYLEKAIAHGGATSEAINLLNQVTPGKDMSEFIRSRFKQFYKDHSITKRFTLPAIPSSYESAIGAYPEINAYFKDLDATINAALKTGKELTKEYENQVQENQKKRMAQMQQVIANAGKPGYAQSIQDMKSSLTNPLMAQGALTMSSIDNPQFSKSYMSRMKTETQNRKNREDELIAALKEDFGNKISALLREKSNLKDGEGQGAANIRMEQIEKEVCKLQQGRQEKWLGEIADINNQYIHNMEDLLNQRLQEYLFWNTVVMQSLQDPTAVNYQFYVQYLKDLNSFRSLYPYYVDGGFSKPCGDYLDEDNTTKGKIHDWEREHCEVDINVDAVAAGAKMNCEGWSIYANFKAGSFKYERSVDPVTWQTTGHSMSAKAGKDKEFEIGKIKGKIGASVETTIKFDGNMNPVDLTVKGAAGAEINGPLGGSAGVDLGSAEISVSSGFNAAGPSIPGFGSDFLK